MNLRRLHPDEHVRTRKLWEEVFKEDTTKFLDYYYTFKTKENEIYVMEENDKIVSMLHLNPYEMRVGKRTYQTHYIVAVATDKAYRNKGLMRQLLNHAMQVMADRGEPFTFLMPAAEAIYKPFGFEFIYEQRSEKVVGKKSYDSTLEVIAAKEENCQEIADFANEYLQKYDVVTQRSKEYYKRLLEEQKSEDGEILIAKHNGIITGIFCYTCDGAIEIREPLFYNKEDLQHIIYLLTRNETQPVLCNGYGSEEAKPIIMAKILSPNFKFDFKKAKVFLNEVV